MIADLRSDTVTKPTPGMLEAMWRAEVGDDVFGEDPSVKELEQEGAALLGMDSAVFCPSGTMTNQIGIRILTEPFDEVICYKGAHIYKYEGGGLAGNSHVSVKLVPGDRGRLSVDDVAANISPNDPHYARTTVVALENTVVSEAGSYYRLDDIARVSEFARSRGLKMHMDGARLFNALAVTGDSSRKVGRYFDTVSICLSKGLGAPVGSLLVCKKELELKARRMRKIFGGGMRQAGYLAAAGLYALRNHIPRLPEDHNKAKKLGDVIRKQPYVKSMMPVDSNIVIFELTDGVTPDMFLAKASSKGLRALAFSKTQIRLVTHLDVSDEQLKIAVEALETIRF